MASTAAQLAALLENNNFTRRVMSLAMVQAITVYNEDPATTNHATRLTFAKSVLNGAGGGTIPAVIVNSGNLVAGNTTFDFLTQEVVTDVSDAAIASQIATSWNMLSGV